MSALGQKRTLTRPLGRCPLYPQKQTSTALTECLLCANSGHHRIALFDHLVGAQLDRWWHVEAERLGGFAIEHHFEPSRGLNGKLARLLA